MIPMAPENFIHFASLKSRGLILLGLKKVTSFDEIIIKYRDSTAHILHVFFLTRTFLILNVIYETNIIRKEEQSFISYNFWICKNVNYLIISQSLVNTI